MRIFILVAALLTMASPALAYDQQGLMNSYFSVVMIRGYNDTGGMSYGSGVVVGKDEVITNCHVLRATKQPWVAHGEDSYPITTVKADTWHDLCLVTTDNLPLNPVKIGSSLSLTRGQEVAGIGHSNGVPAPLTSTGVVKGLYDDDSGRVIRTNAKFMLGASGSGLFDMDGNLIGINTFKTAGRGGSIHFALPVEWLDKIRQQTATTTFPISGKALWEEDEDKKPFYMQAAVPEVRSDWPKLEEVSQQWTKSQPKSSDAWYSLGIAEENLKHADLAQQAFSKAVDIDKGNVDALFQLGVMAKTSGNQSEMSRIQLALTNIDKDLGDQYKQYLQCTQNCD